MTQTIAPEDVQENLDVTLEQITPEQAEEWLEHHNTHNRRIRKGQVANLAQDMQAGRWMFTGDSIKFDQDGTLLDGQHRLAAVLRASVTVPMIVVRGLDPRAQIAIDIQSRRSAADALKLQHQEGDTKNMAAIARGLLMYDEGEVPTHPETVEYVMEHHDELEEAARISEMVRRAGLTGGAFYGIAHILLARVAGEDVAEEFLTKLASGAELEKGSPILLLRRHLAKGLPYGFGRGVWHLRNNLAFVFYAWNAWRDGKELHAMRLPKGQLPEPK